MLPETQPAARSRKRKTTTPASSISEPRSWAEAPPATGAVTRNVTLPPLGRGRMRITLDRVRARPAVTPQVSFMLGQNAIGLGVWGFFFPDSVNRTLGLQAGRETTRLVFGVRELVTGVTLASNPTRADALWARVAGDALDIAVLAPLTRGDNPKRRNARVALGVVLAVTALDLVAAIRMTRVKRNCA